MQSRLRWASVLVSVLVVGLVLVGVTHAATSSESATTAIAPMIAEMPPYCEEICDQQTGCDEVCRYGSDITCGEYGVCESCDSLCGPFSPGDLVCASEGHGTSCYDYGEYARCGDGYCANVTNAEDCHSCSDDCGPCPEIDCGNATCEDLETYRNCDLDCAPPAEHDWQCGNDRCDPNETGESCEEDCAVPEEFCDSFDYFCPYGWECVGNKCVHREYIGVLRTCAGGTDEECPTDQVCRQATDEYETPTHVCVPWWVLL
jgi:hypothetical protein